VAVAAADALRLRRLLARDGRPERDIQARMDAGKPASWYAERATYTLDGGSDDLREQAIGLLDKILCK
jgi:dephospho-CoA kinase